MAAHWLSRFPLPTQSIISESYEAISLIRCWFWLIHFKSLTVEAFERVDCSASTSMKSWAAAFWTMSPASSCISGSYSM